VKQGRSVARAAVSGPVATAGAQAADHAALAALAFGGLLAALVLALAFGTAPGDALVQASDGGGIGGRCAFAPLQRG